MGGERNRGSLELEETDDRESLGEETVDKRIWEKGRGVGGVEQRDGGTL